MSNVAFGGSIYWQETRSGRSRRFCSNACKQRNLRQHGRTHSEEERMTNTEAAVQLGVFAQTLQGVRDGVVLLMNDLLDDPSAQERLTAEIDSFLADTDRVRRASEGDSEGC